jgi:deazaflavin-dependent oxidoreductase (nitroreductase family)
VRTKQQTKTPPPRWFLRGTAPVAKALAGRRWFPIWGVMHHVGRRSGRQYAIPVALVPVVREDVFLIGLPWGPTTNWAQNVLADGRATVTWKGRDWAATNPRVITAEQAAALAKAPLRRLVGSGRFPAFIGLDR